MQHHAYSHVAGAVAVGTRELATERCEMQAHLVRPVTNSKAVLVPDSYVGVGGVEGMGCLWERRLWIPFIVSCE